MSETSNEQTPTDSPEDVEGHNARWPAVPTQSDDVGGHRFRDSAVDSDDDPEPDDAEGHSFKY